MTELHFQDQVSRLRNFYGSGGPTNQLAFHPQRIELVWKSLNRLKDHEFTRICDDLVANQNTAPTLKDFVKFGESVIAANRYQSWAPDNSYQPCPLCIDTEVNTLRERNTGKRRLCLCDCEKASGNIFWKLPTWSQDLSPRWERSVPKTKWFVPQISKPNANPKEVLERIEDVVEKYKTYVRVSEADWKSEGFEWKLIIKGRN